MSDNTPTNPGIVRTATEIALREVRTERYRQEQLKHEGRFRYTCADKELTNAERAVILGEEFGEACRAVLEAGDVVNDKHGAQLRKELIQVAAVAVAWIEALS